MGEPLQAVQVDEMTLSLLERLKTRISSYYPRVDLERLDAAFKFAAQAHEGQKRASGDNFIVHPLEVALIIAELELDEDSVIAALLHDVVEDTDTGLGAVEALFGPEVALLVDGVTKLNRLDFRSRLEAQAENLRKMFLAMAKDIRVILIKLADRLHNMRTLQFIDEERQKIKARETLEIFAPLAHRLGISRIQWELEDIAIRYLEPEECRRLEQLLPKQRQEREALVEHIIGILKARLQEAGIRADVHGRAKHFYSIFRKVYEQGRDLSQIYDLVATRIIVDTVRDCYAALGVVHTLWRPLPGRFKDFIATPKSNMYQSLHTTVFGPGGDPFEVQIRTWEMHRTAEYGIAAHWRYKQGGRGDREFDSKLSWLREILEWQSDLKDAREFMESLKLDVFSDEVYVFTPRGDVIELPAGSTPIDFAYRIHTEIGHRCTGAKANGRIVPLAYKLQSGDIIEILTNPAGNGPNPGWLKIAKTGTARNRIRQFLKRQRREENLERAQRLLEREARAQGFALEELWRTDWVQEVSNQMNFHDVDDMLVTVGYGGLSAGQVIRKLREIYRRHHRRAAAEPDLPTLQRRRKSSRYDPSQAVKVKGIDNLLVRFSRCCNPVPGDPIVGYITRGRGISIHRSDCRNLAHSLAEDGDRRIEVAWDNVQATNYAVHLKIYGIDRPGLLSDVARMVADTRTNILSANARGIRDGMALIDLVLEIRSLDQLEYIIHQIEGIKDIFSVERVQGGAGPRR